MEERTIKYLEIFEYFKEKIENGFIGSGEKLPTEQEIGERFVVSRQTVRQALLELEKQGYICRERNKGAFVKDTQQSEKNKSKMIVVITTYISEYIFPYLIRGIQEVLNQNGYDIMLLSTNNDKEKEKQQLKKLLNYNVVGAIIEPTASALGNINEEYYRELDKNNIPYLMINAVYDKKKQSYVSLNDEKGGYLLCNYLIELGHERIGGLFKEDDDQGIERKNGYIRALQENGVKIDSTIIGRFKTFEEDFYIQGFTKSLLNRVDRPTAIVCYNDKIAMKVIKIASGMGIKIPEELSIVGYDNDMTIATALQCGITTITHPKEAMGRKAGELLLELIKRKKTKVSYVFEPQIIVKDSTANNQKNDNIYLKKDSKK